MGDAGEGQEDGGAGAGGQQQPGPVPGRAPGADPAQGGAGEEHAGHPEEG